MARITVAGDAVVITSALKYEDIQTLAKYRPNSLVLYGGDEGKEPLFRIGVTSNGSGEISKFGASFGGKTHDEDGYATITLMAPVSGEDIKEAVAEKVGVALLQLNKLESQIPEVLEELAAEKAAILSNIQVAQ